MEEIVTSKKFSLNKRDFVRGIFIAMGSSSLMVIQSSIDAGMLIINWKTVLMSGVGGGVTYLIKNFFVPAQTIKQESEPKESAK